MFHLYCSAGQEYGAISDVLLFLKMKIAYPSRVRRREGVYFCVQVGGSSGTETFFIQYSRDPTNGYRTCH
jgi:hypothetical protein